MNLNLLLKKLSDNRFLITATIITSLIGLADALFLTTDYYFGSGVKCLITEGCETVLSSRYAVIKEVPVSAFGIIFYMGIFVLVSLADTGKFNVVKKILIIGTSAGVSVSLVLLYIQAIVLEL